MKDKPIRYMGTYIKKEKSGKRYHITFTYEFKDGKMVNEVETGRVELKGK